MSAKEQKRSEVNLKLKNETAHAISIGETSPQDPQGWQIAAHGEATGKITEDSSGDIHLILCEQIYCSVLWECEIGQHNRVRLTANGPDDDYHVHGLHDPADKFTLGATNSTDVDLDCLVIGPGTLFAWRNIRAGSQHTFHFDTTGYFKIMFVVSYLGQSRFPVPEGAKTITITAKDSGGKPTIVGPAPDHSWSPLGAGMDGEYVMYMTVFDDGSGTGEALYAGGKFQSVGEVRASNIAKWDGTKWSPLGSGTQGGVRALAVFDDALYAGGQFTDAGGVTVNNIAQWDGRSWSALGTGFSDRVGALTVFDDGTGTGAALYAAVQDTERNAGRVAKWDGRSWSPLGADRDMFVVALQGFDDGTGTALYAGGYFTDAGGATVNYVAKWDGTSWSPLGTGFNGPVRTLAVFDDGAGAALYAGGPFTKAGEVTVNYIAKWNGTSWSPLDWGVNNWVNRLHVFDDGVGAALYAGGQFTEAGADKVTVNHIAKWNGTSWSALGAGTDSVIGVLMAFDDRTGTGPALFAGGIFKHAGGAPASNIAKCAVSWWGS